MDACAVLSPTLLLQAPMPLPSTPLTEPWTAWTVLGLGLLFVFSLWYYPLPTLLQLLPDKTLRTSLFDEQAKTDIRVFTAHSLFAVGTTALGIYALLYDWQGGFSFGTYGLIAACTTVFLGVKYGLLRLTGYVFFTRMGTHIYIRSYAQLYVLFSACILPVSVLYVALPAEWGFVPVILLILCSLAWLTALLIIIFRLFFDKIIACLYIILYLCSLEILPCLCLLAALQAVIGQA